LGLGSPEHSLSFCTPLPSPHFFLLDLFNLEVEGSTPTFFLILFVFSSPSRVLSPLLRGEGCNRPMVYYYASSLLYPIALKTSLTLQSLNDSFPFLPFLFFLLLSLLRVATSRRLSLPLSLLSRRRVCVLPKLRYIEPHRRLDSYSHLRVLRRALLHFTRWATMQQSVAPNRIYRPNHSTSALVVPCAFSRMVSLLVCNQKASGLTHCGAYFRK
jgi:hypothetical protein